WRHYSPGSPRSIPRTSFGVRDLIAGVNASFRFRPDIGVVVTDRVGEIELASAFLTYNDASYAARTFALGAAGTEPVRSRHGLVFVPRGDVAHATGLDRLVVPGADAALRPDRDLEARARDSLGLAPEYLHARPDFAFEAALHDLARTVNVPTARWEAKSLEYQTADLELAGPGWPWAATVLPLLYGLLGLAALFLVRLVVRLIARRRPSRRPA
ncbi:hypothetical protein AB0M20_42670, partial [Actinoplanes sp. NPDC051633]|uniref:hypothetical protein n=1 Tax=Actinoplanes sp. NPDC051633 TaxID=3155670 RepID=UPI00341BE120